MNKIEVKGETKKQILKLDKNTNITCIDSNSIEIETKENIQVFIHLINSNTNIKFNIKNNLILNIFSENSTLKIDLDLNEENIKLDYAYSTINIDNNNYTVNINHNKSNIESNIVNHGLNIQNNELNFIINAKVPKKVTNINTNQDSKIILVKEKSASIKPNLLIDNDDIVANHSAYIGDFKKEDIFYLKTRGLTEKSSKKLLAKSFLIGNMKNITFRQIQKIKDKLNLYWRW